MVLVLLLLLLAAVPDELLPVLPGLLEPHS
jgi:hypothetical protein